MSDLVTRDQLAEEIGVAPKTIERWEAEQIIDAAIREGKVLRYSRKACLRRLASRAKKRTPPTKPLTHTLAI